ncbi:nucleobindin 1 isoform X4 [Megalopta genalis]|uniref:nucleobindin 1 isoform X4 n=1 Tax=Megalopta genalis TaxID=115081 RepID=UPI0014432DFD|nr:nucleobindin-2 isoform X4 [Megalopta genalis]
MLSRNTSHFVIKMQYFLLLALTCTVVQYVVAPPVNQKKDEKLDIENEIEDPDEMADFVEYRRYLMEVVQVLESDPEFRAKVKEASQEDIRTGKIADHLQFVDHNIRTRLDEIKRKELERLRHLATRENELRNGLDTEHLKVADHIDHTNSRTFEIYDLKKLMAKTSKDLAENDKKRREEFKKHEMEVKYNEQQKLEHMNEAERKKYEDELKALQDKHKKHEPVRQVHHPGSKQQLEEVWEKQDHMEPEDFNPKTFFYMHDIDGNGVWDQDEVKALFLKELDKLYVQGTSQEELFKRVEEMERMREHVFNEVDLNKDALINYEEFLKQTENPEFQKDEGWQGLDEGQIFTQEEFEEFERKRKEHEIQKMIAQGIPPPQQGSIPAQDKPFPPQYAHPPVPHQDFQHPQQFQQQNPQFYQQQYPNHAQAQVGQGQMPEMYHPQMVQQQQFQGQAPLNQQYQQMPIQQQMPPQQLQPGQIPIQQPHGQMPVQQPPQGQIPVQQPPQGQIPVQQPAQGQIPIQQQSQGQIPIQQQSQGQIPIQQQAQGQVLVQQGQAPNAQQQQNQAANQVPQNVQSNVASQQHNQPNSQSAQVPAQQEINRNNIQTGGKA